MKKIAALLLAVCMILALSACGASQSAPAAEQAAPAAEAPAAEEAAAEATEQYPVKAITMVVPYGAGGTTDLVGRQLAAALSKTLGVSIVVENQPGASGSVGCKAALDGPKDGSMVLFTAESLGTQRVMGISEMSYADFSPIYAVANDPKVIVVAKDSPYNTIEELLKDIKDQPDSIQMAYTGPGGSGHVQALIMNQFGYFPALTAYSSGSDGIIAVMGKQVVFTNSNYSTVANYIEAGELKLLTVCAPERLAKYPDVPALTEYMEGSDALLSIPYTPLSLMVANGVPENVQSMLRSACEKAFQDPDFVSFMESNNIDKLYEKYTTIDEIKAFYSEWESTVCWLMADAGATQFSPEEFGIARPQA